MTKVISMLAIAICMVSTSINAQEKQKEAPKKECSAKEKKSCSKDKKTSCCASKKADKKA
jgi:hypothetical protein